MLPFHCKRLRSARRPSWHSSHRKTFNSCQVRKHRCSALPLMSWVTNVFKLAPWASKESLAILLHSKASSLSEPESLMKTLCRSSVNKHDGHCIACRESPAGAIAPKSVFFRCNEGKAVSTTKPAGEVEALGSQGNWATHETEKLKNSEKHQEALIVSLAPTFYSKSVRTSWYSMCLTCINL